MSAEERAQIQAEEVFREEVRKSLTPAKSRAQRIAAFLNAPFFVALVAVIGVAFISWAWQWHQDRQETARDHDRLETEFISRINELGTAIFYDRVAIAFAPEEQKPGTLAKLYADVREHIRKSPAAEPDEIAGQYLDYRGSSLLILATTLAEFDTHYKGTPAALQALDRLTAWYQSTYGDMLGDGATTTRYYEEDMVQALKPLPDDSQERLRLAFAAPAVLGE